PAAAEAPPRPAPALAVPGTAEADASGLGWGPLLACGVVTLTVFFAALLVPTVRKGLAAPAVSKEEKDLQAEPAPAPPRPPAPAPPARRPAAGRRAHRLRPPTGCARDRHRGDRDRRGGVCSGRGGARHRGGAESRRRPGVARARGRRDARGRAVRRPPRGGG